MTINAIGFDGSIDEAAWVQMAMLFAPVYCVATAASFKVTSGGGGDRAVTVAAGTAWSKGVRIDNTAGVVKNLASVGSGSRYDMIVLRLNWATNTRTIEIVTGTSSQALPTKSSWSTGSQIDDVPLALVRVAAGSTTAVVSNDLRLWSGSNGLYVGQDLLCRSVLTSTGTLNQIGTQIRIDGTTWTYDYDGSTVSWKTDKISLSSPGFAAGAGWEIDGVEIRRVDDQVSLYVAYGRHGAAIPGNGNGNIGNSLIGTIADAKFRPRWRSSLSTYSAGPMMSYGVNAAGQVSLAAVPPDFTFTDGYGPVDFHGTYIGAEL